MVFHTKKGLTVTRNYLFLSCILLASCKSTTALEPVDLNYKSINTLTNVGYLISSSSLEHDIRVMGNCSTKESKFNFAFFEKNSNKKPIQPQWSFFFNNKKSFRSSKIYNENEFNNIINNFQVAKYLGNYNYSPKINLSSEKLSDLIELCKNKHIAYQLERKEKYEQNQLKQIKLINSVKNSTGLNPMFGGKNQLSFNELAYSFINDGFNQHLNKFIWLTDGDYKVSQVLNSKVMLTSYSNNLPPITIITKLQTIEGQFWSKVSRKPLKFIGLNNYKTVLGVSKQTIVFQQL